jgi:hypothetical protein
MKIFPKSILPLLSFFPFLLLRACVLDERDGCTNMYSPKYRYLTRLYDWVDKNCPDKAMED